MNVLFERLAERFARIGLAHIAMYVVRVGALPRVSKDVDDLGGWSVLRHARCSVGDLRSTAIARAGVDAEFVGARACIEALVPVDALGIVVIEGEERRLLVDAVELFDAPIENVRVSTKL